MSAAPDLFQDLQSDQKGYLLLSEYLKKNAGISMPLNNKNLCLMASRLGKVFKKYDLNTYQELYSRITKGDNFIRDEFIMALTTNTTHFFREGTHFEVLLRHLPELVRLDSKDSDFRLWCAAASTGQEPYSLGMTCHEFFEAHKQNNYKILATDIDAKVLEKAAQGIYSGQEVENINSLFLQKYFISRKIEDGKFYRVQDFLSQHITFARLNLLEEKYPFKKKFNVIFCRNVFIYFEKNLVHQIIEKMAEVMHPGGLLFLGHSESGAMRSSQFKMVGHAVYRRI